ncbi:MAG: hypothetical protein AABY22_34020 [Nanoarchaeota archaeon]
MKKIFGLAYINLKGCACINHPHYDLYEDDGTGNKTGRWIACILTDKEGANLIRKWIKRHNEENNAI